MQSKLFNEKDTRQDKTKIMFLKRCLLEILVAEFNSFYSLDNSNKNYGMFRNTRKQLKIFFITKNTGVGCRKETHALQHDWRKEFSPKH